MLITNLTYLIMINLDVTETHATMIPVDPMPIVKREMMLQYAHAHQVDVMTKNDDKLIFWEIAVFQSSQNIY